MSKDRHNGQNLTYVKCLRPNGSFRPRVTAELIHCDISNILCCILIKNVRFNTLLTDKRRVITCFMNMMWYTWNFDAWNICCGRYFPKIIDRQHWPLPAMYVVLVEPQGGCGKRRIWWRGQMRTSHWFKWIDSPAMRAGVLDVMVWTDIHTHH